MKVNVDFNNYYIQQPILRIWNLFSTKMPLWESSHEALFKREMTYKNILKLEDEVKRRFSGGWMHLSVVCIYSGTSQDDYLAKWFFARRWLFAIAIAICKTVFPMGDFTGRWFGLCFADRFFAKVRFLELIGGFAKWLPYGRFSLDDDYFPPLERIKRVSVHSNGETLFAR